VSLRGDVYELDGGRCVGCGRRQRREAGLWAWHVHHVLKQQTLVRRRVPSRYLRGPSLCVLLCWDCHGDQTSCMRRVPLGRLPERVHRACRELGPWAEDALRRYHPEGARA
jgi:hypothetical protein